MRVLLDTNVLARAIQKSHPQHDLARRAIRAIRSGGDEPCIVPQVLYELWVICTRPAQSNGLELTTADTAAEFAKIKQLAPLLRDERAIFDHWEHFVTAYAVKEKNAHDTRLVAAMLRHGLTHFLTFNAQDFRRFTEIQVLTPESIVKTANDE